MFKTSASSNLRWSIWELQYGPEVIFLTNKNTRFQNVHFRATLNPWFYSFKFNISFFGPQNSDFRSWKCLSRNSCLFVILTKKFETSQNFKLKKISRLFKIKFTQFKVFSIRLLVYSISLPQKRVYWWTVLGSVKFYLQICLQFLFWCQIRGHIKSSLSLPFFSPSIDCVRLLRSLGLVICQKLCSPSLH